MCAAGLLAKVARGDESCGGLAADFLQELLEMPQTGQALFRVAAKELRSAFDALSDKARCVTHTHTLYKHLRGICTSSGWVGKHMPHKAGPCTA